MAKFFYTVRDSRGVKHSGTEEGTNEEDVVSRLQAKGFLVVGLVHESKQSAAGLQADKTPTSRGKFKHYGVSGDDLVLFCRQLATLLGAGVTILKSVDIICLQISSRGLYKVLKKVSSDMQAGLSLHEALSRHPQVFSELWVNLVESGEASGNLAMVLSRLAGYLERNAAFRRRIISALLYPIILMVAGLGALLFLTLKIIPTFAELFKGFNVELPFLTKVLISFSEGLRHSFLFIIVVAVLGGYLLRKYLKTRKGRRQYEELLFKSPIFGDFIKGLVVERFSSEMSTLVESGVPILYSLEIAEHSVGNLVMADIIHQIKEDVRDGKPLSYPLEKSNFFEPMVIQMVAIGEEIGELPQMFKKINLFYQEYVETFLTRFASMFEPIMLIVMGVIIGVIVIGMFLPIFSISRIGG
ncbi:MAG: type II secretion system F family protein [Candidatus Omnitrophica bacterium]|jgi:type IV pilus assembly protein PilC|nr:type II secretion system F family protein [Candidatus Omnitrophota bacterium]